MYMYKVLYILIGYVSMFNGLLFLVGISAIL